MQEAVPGTDVVKMSMSHLCHQGAAESPEKDVSLWRSDASAEEEPSTGHHWSIREQPTQTRGGGKGYLKYVLSLGDDAV